jgi:hypothetical protein
VSLLDVACSVVAHELHEPSPSVVVSRPSYSGTLHAGGGSHSSFFAGCNKVAGLDVGEERVFSCVVLFSRRGSTAKPCWNLGRKGAEVNVVILGRDKRWRWIIIKRMARACEEGRERNAFICIISFLISLERERVR